MLAMDVDDANPPQPHDANAHAGPSSPLPVVFLPQPAPPSPPAFLKSTQDLLARFQLLSAYDKHVRAAIAALEHGQDHVPLPHPSTSAATGKGKEREKEPHPAVSPGAHTPPGPDAVDMDDDDGLAHGEKKKKNNYRHLIRGVPGKHSMKRDTYLTTIMQIPPKQRLSILPFDSKTQAEAFTVSPEGLKNWNPSVLVLESAQAREDRKRRKELKKLAKAQQALLPQTPAPLPPAASPSASLHPPHIPIPSTLHMSPARTATPKPVIPRPGSRPIGQVPIATPGLGTPASTASMSPTATTSYLAGDKDKRGKKREFEDVLRGGQNEHTPVAVTSATTVGAGTVNGAIVNGVVPRPVLNAKAGIPGVRPRPIKKQRMDIQGQARDVTVPVQQPTPQGV